MGTAIMSIWSSTSVLAGKAAVTQADTPFLCDFEWMESPEYLFMDLSALKPQLATDGNNSFLQIANSEAGHNLSLNLMLNIFYQPGMFMKARIRVPQVPGNQRISAIGFKLFAEDESVYYMNLGQPQNAWQTVTADFAKLETLAGEPISTTTILKKAAFCFDSPEDTPPTVMQVDFDDIEFYTGEVKPLPSEANPAFFNWRKNMGTVTVEYSMNPDFPAAETFTAVTGFNFFTPPELMTPGLWYYRITSADGRQLAPVAVEVMPNAHRYTTNQITQNTMQNRARPWLQTKRELSNQEREAMLAKFQEYYQAGVPKNPLPYRGKNDPDWPSFISWYGGVHDRVVITTGARLQTMSEIYVQTGDESLAPKLLDYALKVCQWDADGGSSHINGDIGAYHILRGLDFAYDVLHAKYSPEELKPLRNTILYRAKQVWTHLNPFPRNTHREYNNHSWLAVFGMAEGALVLLDEEPDAVAMAEYARQLYVGLFLAVQGYQGENGEGISYWSYGGNFLKLYAEMMNNVCNINLFNHPWLGQTVLFPIYTCIPNAYAVSFANSGKPNHGNLGPLPSQSKYIEELAAACNNPYGVWYSNRPEFRNIKAKIPVDLPQSIHYKHIGWGVANTSLTDGLRNVTVGMHAGKFSSAHQHDDQGNVVINAYGDKLLIDSGYYDYFGSKHFMEYSILTAAHNTIAVDGVTQNTRRDGAGADLTVFEDSPFFNYMVCEAGNPSVNDGKLSRWTRRVIFIKPEFVFTHDIIKAADKPVKLSYLAHAAHPLFASPIEQYFDITGNNAELYAKFLTPQMTLATSTGYPVLPVRPRGNNEPLEESTISKEWHLQADVPEAVTATDILTAMQIRPLPATRAQRAKFTLHGTPDSGRIVEIITDNKHKILLFSNLDQQNLLLANVSTDAEVAAVEFDANGKLVRYFAHNATYLSIDDLKLTSPAPTQFAHPQAPAAVSAPPPLQLGEWELQPSVQERATDVIYYYTTPISVTQDTVVRFSLPESPDVNVILNMKPQRSEAGIFTLTLPPGQHFLLIDSTRPLKTVKIE